MAATLSSLFINQLLFRAYDRFVNPGGVPLLLVLDEAAQLADRVDFESLLSSRGKPNRRGNRGPGRRAVQG